MEKPRSFWTIALVFTLGGCALAPADSTAHEDDGAAESAPADAERADAGPSVTALSTSADAVVSPTPADDCVPSREVCDGIDNDCDGRIDDLACTMPENYCDTAPALVATPFLAQGVSSPAFVVARPPSATAGSDDALALYWRLRLGADAVVAVRSAREVDALADCGATVAAAPLRTESCGSETTTYWRLGKGDWILRVRGQRSDAADFSLQVAPTPEGAGTARWVRAGELAGDGVLETSLVTSQDPEPSWHPACGTGTRWAQMLITGCAFPAALRIDVPVPGACFVGTHSPSGESVCSSVSQRVTVAPRSLFVSLFATTTHGTNGAVTWRARAE